MKVYEGDERPDRYGRYPLMFSGYKNLAEVNEYLWRHYYGYKFAIVFDETKDEYEEYPKELQVYFLDELTTELCEYSNVKVIKADRRCEA